MIERHCVVLAGGLGTRLSTVTNGICPKALVPVLGRPFIDYKILSLRRMRVTHLWLLVGKMGDQIEAHVQKSAFPGLSINVVHDGDILLGTAGSISRIADQLPQRFWVTYGDTFVTAELSEAEDKYDQAGLRIMCVLNNQDRIETSNVSLQNQKVTCYEKSPSPGSHDWIDYGLLRLHRNDFVSLPTNVTVDLHKVITMLVQRRQLAAWPVSSRFWEVGTPESRNETEAYFSLLNWKDL